MATIKGKWRWNEVIDLSVTLGITSGNVPSGFISNGKTYYNLYVLNDVHWTPDPRVCDCLIYGGSLDIASHFKDDGSFVWASQEERVMDFGETEQEISDELYAFIHDNATEYSPISEKLVEVANNVQKVFEAGRQQGHGEGYDDGLEAGKELGGYNEGFEAGYGNGYSQSESDFWDVVQQGGQRTAYDIAFCWWDCEYLRPKYKVVPTYGAGAARDMIYRCAKLKKVEAAYFDLSQLPNPMASNCSLGYLFGLCDELEEIEDIGLPACYNVGYLCYSDRKLKKIAVIRIAESTKVDSMLYYCPELEYVRIEGVIGQSGIDLKYSTKLSKESIESIVNHLSDSATGKTLTLSKAAVDNAFRGEYVWSDEYNTTIWDDTTPGSETNTWKWLIANKVSLGWTISLE